MTLLETIQQNFSSDEIIVSNFTTEKESQTYDACSFSLNNYNVLYRKAKTTPKKDGQFVTFYKRIPSLIIAPFDESDHFDFLIVAVANQFENGWFIFPKNILVDKKIVSTILKEGKRAFRIYPPWTLPKNKLALASKTWQLDYFLNNQNLKSILVEKIFRSSKKQT